MFKKKPLGLSLLFLFSRLVFINNQLLFMDDHEYLSRLTNPNLLTALYQGHPPLHAGFILLFWLPTKFALAFDLSPIIVIKVLNSLLGLGAIWCFWLLAKKIFSSKIAKTATIIVALTPIFWLSNIAILVEPSYIFFFLLSLMATANFLTTQQKRWLGLSGIALGLAFLTNQIVLIYLPAFLLLFSKKLKRSALVTLTVGLAVSLLSASLVLAWLYTLRDMLWPQALSFVFTSKLADAGPFLPWASNILRALRNWLILLLRDFSNLLIIFGVLAFFKLWRDKRGQAIALGLWFLPSLLAAQWWDGLLMGRHLLLAVFPLTLTVAFFVQKHSWLKTLLVVNLLITSLGALVLVWRTVPAVQLSQSLQKLPQNGLLIESHFSRPWKTYSGEVMFVNEPTTAQNFDQEVADSLAQQKPVFVTSQALSDPYGVYTGPYLHPLSLGFRQPPKLATLTGLYQLLPVATPSAVGHLTIYQISSNKPSRSDFQADTVPKWHRNRLDYFDPLSQLWFFLKLDTMRL